MTVTEAMLNSHGICHGGFIFATGGYRICLRLQQSWPERGRTAQQHHIPASWPARRGLTAEATERSRSARSGIYDVRVTGADGGAVAELRGHSRLTGGRVVPEREG